MNCGGLWPHEHKLLIYILAGQEAEGDTFQYSSGFLYFSFCLGHSPLDSATNIKGRCSSSVNPLCKSPHEYIMSVFH